MAGTPPAPVSVDDVDVGRLEGTVGFLLRLAQLKSFSRFFDALGKYGLRPGEFSILAIIDANPGIRQGVLARRLFIKPAHMTRLIRSFEGQGLVERRIPRENRRSVELSLSAKGRAFLRRNSDAFFAYGSEPLDGLTGPEQAQLVRLLQKYLGLDSGASR